MRYMSEKPITLADIASTFTAGPLPPAFTLRGVNIDEALKICKWLGGGLPTKSDFDAFGDTKLENDLSPVWAWSTEVLGPQYGVLRAGGGGLGTGENLSAAGRLKNPLDLNFRPQYVGVRCVWANYDLVPFGMKIIPIPPT